MKNKCRRQQRKKHGRAAGRPSRRWRCSTPSPASGAERFDLTFTDAAGDKVGFRGNRPSTSCGPPCPESSHEAAERQHNVIVRPRSAGAALIQLDDLDEAAAERLRPVSFLVLRTSPGNYQAWVAVADADADFARRLRKGAGADLTASGATRVSGSLNFKEKYAPAFPRVETVHASPGRVVTRAELEALGVVAPPEKARPATIRIRAAAPAPEDGRATSAAWRTRRRHAKAAGPTSAGRISPSACWRIDWGWGVEETAARLMQESGKAQENGEAYALRTARNAAAAIERRGEQQR